MISDDRISSNQFSLTAVLDRFEATLAIFRLTDGQELRWPINRLPDGCAAGSTIRFTIHSMISERQERETIARIALNQLLAGSVSVTQTQTHGN